MLSGIFESFNQDRSRSGNTDLAINLYAEHTDGDDGPALSLLLGTPGLTLLSTIGIGPIRGVYRAANKKMYVVSGYEWYMVDTSFNAILLGSLATNTGAVSMIDSPTQVLVVDGIGGWVANKTTNAFVQVVPNDQTDASGPNSAAYQDGFGLVNSLDSNDIYQSNYNDLSTYASLTGGSLGSTANNAFVQGNPQPVLAMFDLKRELWLFKKDAAEVWINQGSTGFAFTALQGVNIPFGIDAPASICKLGDSIAWLGSDENGNGNVYITVGYQAKPVLTHALAALFQSFDTTSDAIAYAYQAGMHQFYVLTFPSANMTFAYDLVTGKWHQRASYVNGQWNREIPNCHCFFGGNHVVGDYQNGNLYALDENNYTDNGVPRRWLRTWRALDPASPIGIPMSFDMLQILLETGVTTGSDSNPQIVLRWSDDGGYTWIGEVFIPLGKIGATTWRAFNTRMGSTKIGTGMDRIWEISGTDPQRLSITGATWEGGPV